MLAVLPGPVEGLDARGRMAVIFLRAELLVEAGRAALLIQHSSRNIVIAIACLHRE